MQEGRKEGIKGSRGKTKKEGRKAYLRKTGRKEGRKEGRKKGYSDVRIL
jgi:hypothetical protein